MAGRSAKVRKYRAQWENQMRDLDAAVNYQQNLISAYSQLSSPSMTTRFNYGTSKTESGFYYYDPNILKGQRSGYRGRGTDPTSQVWVTAEQLPSLKASVKAQAINAELYGLPAAIKAQQSALSWDEVMASKSRYMSQRGGERNSANKAAATIKKAQQELSDTYGITTYNIDGTVSTNPSKGSAGYQEGRIYDAIGSTPDQYNTTGSFFNLNLTDGTSKTLELTNAQVAEYNKMRLAGQELVFGAGSKGKILSLTQTSSNDPNKRKRYEIKTTTGTKVVGLNQKEYEAMLAKYSRGEQLIPGQDTISFAAAPKTTKEAQQEISDQFGIVTFTDEGFVSTAPTLYMSDGSKAPLTYSALLNLANTGGINAQGEEVKGQAQYFKDLSDAEKKFKAESYQMLLTSNVGEQISKLSARERELESDISALESLQKAINASGFVADSEYSLQPDINKIMQETGTSNLYTNKGELDPTKVSLIDDYKKWIEQNPPTMNWGAPIETGKLSASDKTLISNLLTPNSTYYDLTNLLSQKREDIARINAEQAVVTQALDYVSSANDQDRATGYAGLMNAFVKDIERGEVESAYQGMSKESAAMRAATDFLMYTNPTDATYANATRTLGAKADIYRSNVDDANLIKAQLNNILANTKPTSQLNIDKRNAWIKDNVITFLQSRSGGSSTVNDLYDSLDKTSNQDISTEALKALQIYIRSQNAKVTEIQAEINQINAARLGEMDNAQKQSYVAQTNKEAQDKKEFEKVTGIKLGRNETVSQGVRGWLEDAGIIQAGSPLRITDDYRGSGWYEAWLGGGSLLTRDFDQGRLSLFGEADDARAADYTRATDILRKYNAYEGLDSKYAKDLITNWKSELTNVYGEYFVTPSFTKDDVALEWWGSKNITGDSWVGYAATQVGQVRSGDYWAQDMKKVLVETKKQEDELRKTLEERKTKLVDYQNQREEQLAYIPTVQSKISEAVEKGFNPSNRYATVDNALLGELQNKSTDIYLTSYNKAATEAEIEYIEKSINLTEQERKELERLVKEQEFYSTQDVTRPTITRVGQSPGRPSLQSFASRQMARASPRTQSSDGTGRVRGRGGPRRSRGGLGGLVI